MGRTCGISRAGRRTALPVAWALVLAALASAIAVAGCRPGPPTLSNISSVDELKARFNRDGGKPRIILLLSPT